MIGADTTSYRYKAFISYNHRDVKFARRLHGKLEAYKFPKSMATPDISSAERPLYPIFLDESELKAGSTLSDSIQDALRNTEYLIVICSENSVGSKWVRAELDFMRELNGDDRVIAVIADKKSDESHLTQLFDGSSEHLAADFRPGKDQNLQFLKIVATLTGAELDDLYQRESRRRAKRMTGIAAGLSAVAVLMSGLAAQAYVAEKEAVRQRSQSEEIVAFMINEFRDDLEKLDKLDLLAGVGEKAQDYFDDRDISGLPDSSIRLQSRTLRQLSDVDEKRGDLVSAVQRISSAFDASALILKRYPNDRDALTEHAENADLYGYFQYQLGDLPEAERLSRIGMDIYKRAYELFPQDNEIAWRNAVAEQNVGVMILQSGRSAEARPLFEQSLRALEEQYDSRSLSEDELYEFSNIYTWYTRSLPDTIPLEFLFETREKQLALFRSLDAAAPGSLVNKAERLNIERAVVILLLNAGRDDEAEARMLSIQKEFAELLDHDPENIGWRRHLMRSKLTLARLHHKRGRINDRNRQFEQVLDLWDKPDGDKWLITTDIVLGIDRLRARRLFEETSVEAAITDLDRAEKEIRDYRKDKIRPRDKYNIAGLNNLKAELYLESGQAKQAGQTQSYVLELLSGKDSYTLAEQKLKLKAMTDLGLTDDADALRRKLTSRGVVLDF